MDINVNDLLANTKGFQGLPGPSRVLYVPAKKLPQGKPETKTKTKPEEVEQVLLIELPRPDPKRPGYTLDYMKGPYWKPLDWLKEQMDSIKVYRLHMTQTFVPDSDLLAQAKNEADRARLRNECFMRNARYRLIAPLIKRRGKKKGLRTPLEVLLDPRTLKRLAKVVQKHGCSRAHVYSLLHLFWGGGSVLNALRPRLSRCGGSGKRRTQSQKLGRHTDTYKDGSAGLGYILDPGVSPEQAAIADSDRAKLAAGYRLIRGSVRPYRAYLLTMGAFWADHVEDPNGVIRPVMFAKDKRPTFGQFMYWGKLLNNDRSVTEALLGSLKWNQKYGARGGSIQDQVSNVLQMLVMDSTGNHVWLVSQRSRLVKLRPATRIVVKDMRSDLVLGFYVGWRGPSQRTALLALHSAAASKVETCARFGITIRDEDWPSGVAPQIQVDHGEMKGAHTEEAERQFGFGIDVVPRASGQKKGSIEAQHRSDHQKVDAQTPGYTGGGQRDPSAPHPAAEGLWNYPEHMHQLLKHYIRHNTDEEVPELAPADMTLAGIRPTRLNIFNWLRDLGQTSELHVDTDALRTFCLPDVDAVIHKNGVYLKVDVGNGRKKLLPRLRYSSPELVASGLMRDVRRSHQVIETRLKMDEERLRHAWLVTRKGIIPLTCQARDTTLLDQVPLSEWISTAEEESLRRKRQRGAVEQRDLNTVLEASATTLAASVELREELADLPHKPSVAWYRQDMRKRAAAEEEDLRRQDAGRDPDHFAFDPSDEFGEELAEMPLSAAALAMRELNRKEFGSVER